MLTVEYAGQTENYSVVNIVLRRIFTECDVYKTEEINKKFSENMCSNLMDNAIWIKKFVFLVEN